MYRLNHVNHMVPAPREAAEFYRRHLMPDGEIVVLGDSVHLRDAAGSDLAFMSGPAVNVRTGAHHGFLAPDSAAVDAVLARLRAENVQISDDCTEDGFRSVKFIDPFGYECEVYWERDWPR